MKKRIPWKVFFAGLLCICIGMQFMPVFGEDGDVQAADWTSSGTVQADLEAYEASGEDISFDLSLTFTDPETIYQEGETLQIGLPSGTVGIQDSAEPYPVYGYIGGTPSELIGSYTIQNGTMVLSFSQKAAEIGDLTPYTAEIHLEAALPAGGSGGSQYAETVWAFPAAGGAQNAVVRVPTASVMSWTGTDPSGMVTMSVGSVSGNGSEASVILTSAIADGASASYSYALPGWADALQTSGTVYAAGGLDVSPNGSFSVADHVMTVTLNDAASGAEMRLPFTWADRVSTPLPAEETATPVETAQPEETAVPEETVQPDGTPEQENPSETALPAQTENPAGTAEPENTVQPEPKATATPEATGTPVSDDGEKQNPQEENPAISAFSLQNAGTSQIEYGDWQIKNVTLDGNAGPEDIYWIDNNNGGQTRPSEDDFKNYFDNATVTAKVTVGAENPVPMTLLEILKLLSGQDYQIQEENLSQIKNAVYDVLDMGGTGHWQLSASALPSEITMSRTVTETDSEGNVTDGTEETKTITFEDWSISFDESKVDGKYSFVDVMKNDEGQYVDQHDRSRPGAMGEGWHFVEETTYTAKIVVRRGTNAVDTSLVDDFKNTIMETYSFCYATGIIVEGNDINSGSFKLSDVYALQDAPVDIQLTDTGFGDPNNTSIFDISVSGLEKYNLNGAELIFNIDRLTNEGTSEPGIVAITKDDFKEGLKDHDYLAEEIVNDAVSNHGTNTTELYSGGTMYLTLTGYTDYTATKKWYDKDREEAGIERPEVKYELWRYTLKPGLDISEAFKAASPVKATKDSAGASEYELQTASVTLEKNDAKDEFEFGFKDSFEPIGKPFSEDEYLPKYDPEGFTYVYFTREEMSGPGASYYRSEFGDYDQSTDSFTGDKLPADYNGSRGTDDTSLYDTGVMANVLTSTTSAPVTKTWIADAFQSELEDVVVEFTLQSKKKNSTDVWMDVTDSTGQTVTYRMGDAIKFTAENLTQSYTASMPKYNNLGEELEYQWVESKIIQGSNDIPIDPDTHMFTLTQNEQQVKYEQIVEDNVITNKIYNVTELSATKIWDAALNPQDVAFRLYRTDSVNNQERLYSLDEDGNPSDFILKASLADGETNTKELYVKNGEDWVKAGKAEQYVDSEGHQSVHFTELVKYDAGGAPYDYIVLEGEDHSWTPQYSVDVDANGYIHYTITNVPVGGKSILARKHWLDDGDEQHRADVTYTVYQLKEGVDQNTFAFDDLNEVAHAVLNRSNNWWMEVGVAEEVDLNRIIVLETQVGTTTLDSSYYTAEILQEIFTLQHADNSDDPDGLANNPYVRYIGEHHDYEASYSMVSLENLRFYTVTNRRLGTVNISVTKNWVDGTDEIGTEKRNELIKALNDNGYDLVLQLVPGIQDADVDAPEIDYETGTVKIGNEAVEIVDDNGAKAGAIQKITNEDNKVYYFYGLPKYNLYGKLVRYSVKEMAYDKATGTCVELGNVIAEKRIVTEYTFSMSTDSYTVPVDDGTNKKAADEQRMTATNRVTGTKDVYFWKEWNDAYRLNLGQRPDIYLDLYRLDPATGQLVSVYKNRKWKFTDQNISFCDFGTLDKYDENGNEIIYYAKEQTFVNKKDFDYKDVYYKYDLNESLSGLNPETDKDKILDIIENLTCIGNEQGYIPGQTDDRRLYRHTATDADGKESTEYLLKEGGIFVNDLSASVVISGKKIWANVPTGFAEDDLLPVTFYLFRYGVDDNGDQETIPTDKDSIEMKDDKATLCGKESYADLTIQQWSSQKYLGEYNFALEYKGTNNNVVNSTDGSITVSPASSAVDETKIPKYDEEGNLYTYVLRESADFSGTDAEDAANADGEKPASYVFKQPTINNYAITNTYSPKTGEIKVRKYLDTSGYDASLAYNKNVVFTFTLTREYTVNGVRKKDDVYKVEKTITFEKFENGSQDITFDNLEIYAPNGNKYIYTVTENTPQTVDGGFEVYTADGIADGSDSVTNKLTAGNDNSYSVSNLYPLEYQDQGGAAGLILGALENLASWLGISPQADDDSENAVTFKNVYTPDDAPLSFDKKWDDGGLTDLRINTPMTFEVRFKANSQPGQNNAIGERLAGTFKIDLSNVSKGTDGTYTVTANNGLTFVENPSISLVNNPLKKINSVTVKIDDNNNTWTITVNDLPVYAPNGMSWIFSLKETDVYPYVISNNSRTFEYNKDSDQFISTTPLEHLTNSIYVKMQATKNPRYSSDPDKNFDSSSQEIYNETGYNVEIKYELYAKFVTADNWEDAQKKFVSNSSSDQTVQEWISLYDNPDNPYVQALSWAANKNQSSFTVSHTFNNGTGFGKKSVAIDNLPRAIQKDGKTVFVTYILLETEVKLINPNNNIIAYQEIFEPRFVYTQVPDGIQINRKDEYESGDYVVAYYFESSAQICREINGDKQTYEDTQYLFMKPLFGSESDVTGYDGGEKVDNASIWTFDFDVYEEWLPYIWIDRYDEKDSSKKTFINDQFNLFDTVEISVEKEWVKDHEDIYNTRPVNAQGKWVVDYQLQQSPDGSSWVDFTSNKYAAITEDSADNKVTYTHLPADGIFAEYADGNLTGYTAAETLYYRVLEKNTDSDNTLLQKNETFNEAYNVTYAPDRILTSEQDKNLKMTNTLITIDIEATKKWNVNDATDGLTSPVTFELQYEAYVLNPDGTHATDENRNELKEWKSFDTSAKVHLDGTADTETDYDGNKWEIYYEDTAWHAVWKDVPKAMPGSVKDVSGQTNYRVVEVVDDNNAYSDVVNTEAPGGNSVEGTEGNGYILNKVTSPSTGYDLVFEIENDLTELKISKTIEKPSGATLNSSVSDKDFTFTITNAADIPNSAKYRIYNSDGTELAQLTPLKNTSGTASFNLKADQYAVIYGLKKGKEYTVTETGNDGYAVQYQINSETEKYSTNSQVKYTVPETKPADTPVIAMTNERLGSITINKKDADDKALSGISFKLEVVTVNPSGAVTDSEMAEYFDTASGTWIDCSVSTTGNDGEVVFSNLSLDLADDQRYRLVEVSAPGYHKYPVDILFDLPYSTDSAKGHPMDGQSDQNSWFYEINGINYYPDISITIENDKVFIMPQTAGSGIFWPGIAGAALAAAAAGIYLLTRKRRKEESRDLG